MYFSSTRNNENDFLFLPQKYKIRNRPYIQVIQAATVIQFKVNAGPQKTIK